MQREVSATTFGALPKRKTKIICTMGPATQGREALYKLAEAGMNVARLNFSHGSHEDFANVVADLRAVEERIGRPIGILGDLQGPKIRTGRLENKSLDLLADEVVYFTAEQRKGGIENGKKIISTGYREFIRDVPIGGTILLDDGMMALKVEDKEGDRIVARVVVPGVLKENKGIHVPEASFSAPAITDQDYSDILFAVEQNFDYLALSFVRTAQEVRHLKTFLHSRGKNIGVIAKIEKADAMRNLDEIIDASDGILVARGDLAVEMGNERVPVLQKKMVRRANLRGKTAIIATQMLMSMVDNPRPSRAEASDVANAITEGADAVMLSNETAVGKYPVETVQMMERIVAEMEAEEPDQVSILSNQWLVPQDGHVAMAVLQGAVRLASLLDAKLNAVVTQSGRSALLLSKCRPKNRVIAITTSRSVYSQMALYWGVEPLLMEDVRSLISQTTVFESIGERLRSLNLCGAGDTIVITAGLPSLENGSTNTIKVHRL